MLDAVGLYPAASRFHEDRALSFELRFDPALEHIDHLQIDLVIVALGDFLRPAWRHEAYDMGLHHTVGGPAKPEITISRVIAEAVSLEVLFPMMAHCKFLRRPRFELRGWRRAAPGCTLRAGPTLHVSWLRPCLRHLRLR